jgi:hypothetical protein
MEPDLFQQRPPDCTCDGDGLTLVGRVPRVGAMRELFTYRCEACGHVETLEAQPNEQRTIWRLDDLTRGWRLRSCCQAFGAHVGDGHGRQSEQAPSLRWRVFYAGRLAQFVRSQHQMMHIPKTGFIVGNRPAEGAERSHQDLTAIEIGTHMVEYAMQLELYSIYSRLRSH